MRLIMEGSPDFFSDSTPEHDRLEVPEGVTKESIDFILSELIGALTALQLQDMLAKPIEIGEVETVEDLRNATQRLKDRIQKSKIADAKKEAVLEFIDALANRLLTVRGAVEDRES